MPKFYIVFFFILPVLHSINDGDGQDILKGEAEQPSELVTPGGMFSNSHQTEYSVDELMSSESESLADCRVCCYGNCYYCLKYS